MAPTPGLSRREQQLGGAPQSGEDGGPGSGDGGGRGAVWRWWWPWCRVTYHCPSGTRAGDVRQADGDPVCAVS